MFGCENLKNKTFLDAGCGSGLFSLAAKELGADVFSFDFDENSVTTTQLLKANSRCTIEGWTIERGSLLDQAFLSRIGQFDCVYCWGVAHHTGAMWLALSNLKKMVGPNGQLFIAIYNDQGFKSRVWWLIKNFYCILPKFLQTTFVLMFGSANILAVIIKELLQLKTSFIRKICTYKKNRGMSLFTDLRDWYGGFPYGFCSSDILREFF